MKTKTILGVGIFALFIFIACYLNPSKQEHSYAIIKKCRINNPFKINHSVNILMEEMMINSFIEMDITYKDYLLFSISEYRDYSQPNYKTVGFMGEVFLISN